MKRIVVADHELSVTDFSHLELALHAVGAKLTAVYVNRQAPDGTPYVQLSQPAVVFDETQAPETDLDHLLRDHGFRPRQGL